MTIALLVLAVLTLLGVVAFQYRTIAALERQVNEMHYHEFVRRSGR